MIDSFSLHTVFPCLFSSFCFNALLFYLHSTQHNLFLQVLESHFLKEILTCLQLDNYTVFYSFFFVTYAIGYRNSNSDLHIKCLKRDVLKGICHEFYKLWQLHSEYVLKGKSLETAQNNQERIKRIHHEVETLTDSKGPLFMWGVPSNQGEKSMKDNLAVNSS